MKHTLFSILFLLSIPFISRSQLVPDKFEHDFGNVTEDSSRVVDFKITNEYSDNVVPWSTGFDFEISQKQYPYTVAPDSSYTLRVKLNPNSEGPVEKRIIITTWNHSDTLELIIKANVLSWSYDKNEPAPEIDRPREPNEELKQFLPVKFQVVDKNTKKPINDASINFSYIFPPYEKNKTDESGFLEKDFQNGYSVSVYRYGYQSYYGKIYLGCDDSVRVIELEPYSSSYSGTYEAYHGHNEKADKAEEDMAKLFHGMKDSVVMSPLDESFSPNNVVLLMDISFSMIEELRSELLVESVVELIKILRPEDVVSVITFASETKVLFEALPATEENKKTMIQKVKGIQFGGLTDGGKGFETAYQLIDKNLKKGGNNQLIVTTDGGLNDYIRHRVLINMVKKNSANAVTSVMMLRGYKWAYAFMGEISDAGKGHLLPVTSEKESTTVLIKEIKLNSGKK